MKLKCFTLGLARSIHIAGIGRYNRTNKLDVVTVVLVRIPFIIVHVQRSALVVSELHWRTLHWSSSNAPFSALFYTQNQANRSEDQNNGEIGAKEPKMMGAYFATSDSDLPEVSAELSTPAAIAPAPEIMLAGLWAACAESRAMRILLTSATALVEFVMARNCIVGFPVSEFTTLLPKL